VPERAYCEQLRQKLFGHVLLEFNHLHCVGDCRPYWILHACERRLVSAIRWARVTGIGFGSRLF
jgi:hypothetical protein